MGKKRKSKKERKATAAGTDGEHQSGEKKGKDKKRKSGENNEEPNVITAGEDQSEVREDKKKRRKNSKENQAPTDTERTSNLEVSGSNLLTKPMETKNLSGGLMIEELEVGHTDAKVASSGKKASQLIFASICF